ncbi:unnamed protein product [Anisakis simplex]|uniref:LisH domain-containing protein n=1 Tax=Anisakis simplex TaxID=6269 RepID=A0A0M3JUM5_ANISI|nr:unnamed protein product [Anisakis simplex]
MFVSENSPFARLPSKLREFLVNYTISHGMDTTALKMEETSAQCSSIGTLKNVSDQLPKPQQRNIETHLDSSGADKISDSINNTNNNQKDTDSESSKITSTLEAVIESAICSRSAKPTSLSYMGKKYAFLMNFVSSIC